MQWLHCHCWVFCYVVLLIIIIIEQTNGRSTQPPLYEYNYRLWQYGPQSVTAVSLLLALETATHLMFMLDCTVSKFTVFSWSFCVHERLLACGGIQYLPLLCELRCTAVVKHHWSATLLYLSILKSLSDANLVALVFSVHALVIDCMFWIIMLKLFMVSFIWARSISITSVVQMSSCLEVLWANKAWYW